MSDNAIVEKTRQLLNDLMDASMASPVDDLTEPDAMVDDLLDLLSLVTADADDDHSMMFHGTSHTDGRNGEPGQDFAYTTIYIFNRDGAILYEVRFGEIRKGRFALTIDHGDSNAHITRTMLFRRTCFRPEQEAYLLLSGIIDPE